MYLKQEGNCRISVTMVNKCKNKLGTDTLFFFPLILVITINLIWRIIIWVVHYYRGSLSCSRQKCYGEITGKFQRFFFFFTSSFFSCCSKGNLPWPEKHQICVGQRWKLSKSPNIFYWLMVCIINYSNCCRIFKRIKELCHLWWCKQCM